MLKTVSFLCEGIFSSQILQFCSVKFGKEETPTQEPSVSSPIRHSRPTIVQRKQAKSSRRERQPRRNVPSKAQRLAWLREADAYVVGLVRRVTNYEQLCDADVDDIAQAVRIRLVDDLKRFDPTRGRSRPSSVSVVCGRPRPTVVDNTRCRSTKKSPMNWHQTPTNSSNTTSGRR